MWAIVLTSAVFKLIPRWHIYFCIFYRILATLDLVSNRGIWAAGVGTSEGWVPHGCKVDGFMNTVMPQYNSQPPRKTRWRATGSRTTNGQNPQRSHRPPPRPPTLWHRRRER